MLFGTAFDSANIKVSHAPTHHFDYPVFIVGVEIIAAPGIRVPIRSGKRISRSGA
jgi:hypothetical protein